MRIETASEHFELQFEGRSHVRGVDNCGLVRVASDGGVNSVIPCAAREHHGRVTVFGGSGTGLAYAVRYAETVMAWFEVDGRRYWLDPLVAYRSAVPDTALVLYDESRIRRSRSVENQPSDCEDIDPSWCAKTRPTETLAVATGYAHR